MPLRLPLARLLCTGAVVLLAACGKDSPGTGGITPVTPPSPQPDVGTRPTGIEMMPRLARSVNMGNMLEASPREGDWGLRLTESYFTLARSAGFLTVRVPIRFSNYAALTPPYTLSDSILTRVQELVTQARAHDLNIVLDLHHYRQISGEPLDPGEPQVAASLVEDRLVEMWRQIAVRFRDEPNNSVMFELLNEPNGTMTPARWNALLPRVLAAVRQSNPDRIVIVGPTSWNDASALGGLSLPDDPRLVVTIHSYAPTRFTFQGADWIGPDALTWLGTGCCTTAQIAEMNEPLNVAKLWAGSRWPIWVGEFGSYSAAVMSSRVQYTRIMRDAIEAHGFGWAYWELAAGFGIYDPGTGTWRTALQEALLGK